MKHRFPVVTLVFIIILLFCFNLEIINGKILLPGTIISRFGITRSNAFSNQFYRLITANIFHMNVGHLLSNIIGLIFFLSIYEILLGKSRAILIIIISAFGGTLGSISINMVIGMVGASTIVFGVFGGLGVLLIKYENDLGRYKLIGYIVWSIDLIVICFSGYLSLKVVDQGAHAGGFIFGIIGTHFMTYKCSYSELRTHTA